MGALRIAVLRSAPDLEGKLTGGARYQAMVVAALRKHYDTRVYYLYYRNPGQATFWDRVRRFTAMAWALRTRRFDEDVLLLDRRTMFLVKRRPGKRYIGLNHHHSTSGKRLDPRKALINLSARVGFRKMDVLVAVSQFWASQFRRMGARNVRVIHNAFDPPAFDGRALAEFRERYGLPSDQPVVYLGVSDPAKGVIEAFEALRDTGWLLVTTGRRGVALPCLHLDLEYEEYLKLLAVATVAVQMSRIEEGWSRIAHEAMLMGTPVIGSGRGGMTELLEGGGQSICEQASELAKEVDRLVRNDDVRRAQGERGRAFARQFTRERFEESWLQLVRGVEPEPHP